MHSARRLALPASLVSAGLVLGASALTTASAATLPPTTPGQVVFSSDRASLGIGSPAADGSDARIWVTGSPLVAAGAPVQVTSEPAGSHVQDRDPDWSPDRTQIAYAAGAPIGAGNPDAAAAAIRVLDLRTGAQHTLSASVAGQDDPAFSPDGATIAFVAGGQLWVKAADAAAAAPARALADDVAHGKPAWSPDGSAIYFTRQDGAGRDIYKVTTGTNPVETLVIESDDSPTSEGIDNFDPAVSPDGTAVCFSRTLPGRLVPELAKLTLATGTPTAIVTDSDGGTVGGDPSEADEGCTWAPDSKTVIFTATPGFPAVRQGDASNLHVASAAGEALADPTLTGLNDVAHFDGAADWAADLSPVCDDKHVQVQAGHSVTIPLSCTDPDAGALGRAPAAAPIDPAFKVFGGGAPQSPFRIVTGPQSGHVEGIATGGVRPDGTIVYTAGATTGTVTFTYNGTDGASRSAPATLTVDVVAPVDGDNPNGGGNPGPQPGPVPQPQPLPGPVALKLSGLKVAPATWVSGRALARVLPAKAKAVTAAKGLLIGGRCVTRTHRNIAGPACVRLSVGTTISFRSTAAAQVTIGFQRLKGRRFGAAQSLKAIGVRAGLTRVHFEGRLTRTKALASGTYRIVLTARDAAGKLLPRVLGPRFTISKRKFTRGGGR